MKNLMSRAIDLLFVLLLAFVLATPQGAFAQNHVVSPADLQKDIATASAARQQNLATLEQFFSSQEAQRALKSAHIDYKQVKDAIPQLSNEDLTRLSNLAAKSQKSFVAGTLSDRDLLIILLAAAALILIIVAVHS